MWRRSVIQRAAQAMAVLLLAGATGAHCTPVPYPTPDGDDVARPAAVKWQRSPAATLPEPQGLLTLALVGLVVAHRSRKRWSR